MRLPEVAKDRRAESNMYTTNVATPIGICEREVAKHREVRQLQHLEE